MLKKIAANLYSCYIKRQGTVFFSYETIIAYLADGDILCYTDKYYSRTTSEHIGILKKLYPKNMEVKEEGFEHIRSDLS